jgi:hypothetical protein
MFFFNDIQGWKCFMRAKKVLRKKSMPMNYVTRG